MSDQRNNRWNWEISGFDHSSYADLVHRPDTTISSKLHRLDHNLNIAREDCLELKQEANDLQEYCNAKIDRVARYLGVLAEKTRKLDQATLETEARISPLIYEKKRLFNDLLASKGNIRVFCRARPLFEDEGPSIIEFPDDCTIRINTGDDTGSNLKKDFEFDRVYGPHVGQVELFNDVQPYVQSALDGYNVSIFAYGQSSSGKTYTMEGSIHDRGLYARCFEELFDLSNADSTSTSRFDFSLTVCELYNEQILDLLSESGNAMPKVQMGSPGSFVELVQERIDNPLVLSRVLKPAFQNRGTDVLKFNVSQLIITYHIYYNNLITGENLYSKLSLVDLAGSEGSITEDDTGERVTDFLHVMKSLSALGDVLSSLTSKKDIVPYENSMLTKLLSDSLGGSSKTLMVVNICPNVPNMSETLCSLNYSARSRNAVLSLGSRDTIKKWRDVANESRKELYEKEQEINYLKQEVLGFKQELEGANDQGVLLFNEVQKAWKVSIAVQSDLKCENNMLTEKYKMEKDQNAQLRNQVSQLLQLEQEQKLQIEQRDLTIKNLKAKIGSMELQLIDAHRSIESRPEVATESEVSSIPKATEDSMDSISVTKKLEEELLKRDGLIERLHEENEKLFNRLTEKATLMGSPQVSNLSSNGLVLALDLGRNGNATKGCSTDVSPVSLSKDKTENIADLVKPIIEKVKTPAGEYLTAALNEFDFEQYDSLAAISDCANKLLMLVLAAVIKAGASREHEILDEIRDAVFSFIRKMELKRVMDTMLVSRVRILYIRSLIARSPELQSIKASPVVRFLERANSVPSRSSSQSNSPGKSPICCDSSTRSSIGDEQIQGFKVNIKQEKKSKFSSVVLMIRGIDQETWRQHVTGGKLREMTEEAKTFALGNKALAALFVYIPAGELQRQIRSWLAENFEFLSVTGDDIIGGTTGQLELLSTAIMDGWMAGLGAAMPPKTDALGQLLSDYAKRVYTSQLQHLKDIAGTLATEEADDSVNVAKLRSALESVDHKRQKIMQQMRSDVSLITLEHDESPVHNPSTDAEGARLSSLISLDSVLKQIKDILRQSSVNSLTISRKKELLANLDELAEQMTSLVEIDHSCAQRQIANARRMIKSILEGHPLKTNHASGPFLDLGLRVNVSQWNVLQFNTGSTTPFIVKCGSNSNSELLIKADSRIQEPKGDEIVRVVPRPTALECMSLEDMKPLFSQLPEALSVLALARTADGTRARYSRLYRTLAMKVPSLRDLVNELELGGVLKDVRQ